MYNPQHQFKEAQFEPEQEQKMKSAQFHIQLYSNSQVKLQKWHKNKKISIENNLIFLHRASKLDFRYTYKIIA